MRFDEQSRRPVPIPFAVKVFFGLIGLAILAQVAIAAFVVFWWR